MILLILIRIFVKDTVSAIGVSQAKEIKEKSPVLFRTLYLKRCVNLYSLGVQFSENS